MAQQEQNFPEADECLPLQTEFVSPTSGADVSASARLSVSFCRLASKSGP